MIEDIKAKAVSHMLQKIGETVETNSGTLVGLVKFNRLDASIGKIATDFKKVALYIAQPDLANLGNTVTVRGIIYDVVKQHAKSEYNGFAKIELTEVTHSHATAPVIGEWR